MPNFEFVFKLIEEKFKPEDVRIHRIPIVQMLREHLKLGIAEAKQISDAHLEAVTHVEWVDGKRQELTRDQQLAMAHGYWIAKEFKRIISSSRCYHDENDHNHLGLVKGMGF